MSDDVVPEETKEEREPYDNYPTPIPLAKAIVARVREIVGDVTNTHYLLEPSAGSGVFVREMKAAWPLHYVTAVEIRGEEKENCEKAGAGVFIHSDLVAYLKATKGQWRAKVLSIGNPPFSLAQEHAEVQFDVLPAGSLICCLLRLSFFGSLKRVPFWATSGLKYLKYLIPIVPRPSFKKGASDNSEYAVYMWEVGYEGKPTILSPILWDTSPAPVANVTRHAWKIRNQTTGDEIPHTSKRRALTAADSLNKGLELAGQDKAWVVIPNRNPNEGA